MARYFTRRLLQMVVLFLVFITLTWFLLYALPGDIVAQKFAGNPNLPPEARQIAIERLGLDKPIHIQFADYMTNFFQGDLGTSFNQYPRPGDRHHRRAAAAHHRPVPHRARHLLLGGFIAGKYLAWRRGKRGEMAITVGGVGLFTVFYPWFALVMIWLFAAAGMAPDQQVPRPAKWRQAPFAANEVFMRLFWTVAITSALLFTAQIVASKLRDVRSRDWPGGAEPRSSSPDSSSTGGEPGGIEMRFYAGDIARHLLLPVGVLTLVNFAGIMLLTAVRCWRR
jgi:peptide/nickel transport system permease protein